MLARIKGIFLKGKEKTIYGGLYTSLTVENNYLPHIIIAYNVTRQMPISMHIS